MKRSSRTAKPRAIQGELRNLTSYAREPLHAWLREKAKPVTYKEIRRRLKTQFGVQVSTTGLSDYYHDRYEEIHGYADDKVTVGPQTIIIRLEVPAGCRIDVSTESEGAAESL